MSHGIDIANLLGENTLVAVLFVVIRVYQLRVSVCPLGRTSCRHPQIIRPSVLGQNDFSVIQILTRLWLVKVKNFSNLRGVYFGVLSRLRFLINLIYGDQAGRVLYHDRSVRRSNLDGGLSRYILDGGISLDPVGVAHFNGFLRQRLLGQFLYRFYDPVSVFNLFHRFHGGLQRILFRCIVHFLYFLDKDTWGGRSR